jgi:hypothetical protein
MKMKPEYIEGFSKSAWKSLAVKSQRIGWVTGLERACAALGKSELKSILICGLFEDTFPAVDEFQEAMAEIRRLDFEALCSRETHHGRAGITAQFYAVREQAMAAAGTEQSRLWAEGRRLKVWLPRRCLNCFWTWLHLHPTDSCKRRSLDNAPWRGMPAPMVDSHTLEGKRSNVGATILSGHYKKHLELSELVAAHGWDWVRAKVHSGPKVQPHQTQLALL